jgi:hypothetical protein
MGSTRSNEVFGKKGYLDRIDNIPWGDHKIVAAITEYADYTNTNRSSQRWAMSVQHIENMLFGAGRHYADDVLINRLAVGANADDLSVARETLDSIPRPVNDFLGRYIETNIALLTENRPRPRVTPKSEDDRAVKAAELSELTLDYLWEALEQPEKMREIARLILYTGTCWMEYIYDPSVPRRMTVPQTETEERSFVQPPGRSPIQVPIEREVTKRDAKGNPVFTDKVEYGDITSTIVSSFEMHVPNVHTWSGKEMGWIMREYFTSVEGLRARYETASKKRGHPFTKKNGWFLDRLPSIVSENVTTLPLWWWERLTSLVEGPGTTLYSGTPEQWDGYAVVRIFDRKPNAQWPRGRTVIVAGGQVIYDSPKERGARAYDPRWPTRWHPYVRHRWEPMPGSVYARSLVSKLLPKIKRINSIDTTKIMWRRTVPIATWIAPKGSQPAKDMWSGRPGLVITYDPVITRGAQPTPIQPTPYPEAAEREREQQIQEMDFIAGTEEILRGQRPTGVSSYAAIELLRKQALSSRSAILQAWDESLEASGTGLLQEVIKHIRDDSRYLERIRVIARERFSSLTIERFSGEDISDNVIVRTDTASQALLSKEAEQSKAIEFMQYAQILPTLPFGLQQALLDSLGYGHTLNPQGVDVERVRRMISWIKDGDFQRVIPSEFDDPYVAFELLVQETKKDSWWQLDQQQQGLVNMLIQKYQFMIQVREAEQLKMQQMMANSGAGLPPEGEQGGGQGR